MLKSKSLGKSVAKDKNSMVVTEKQFCQAPQEFAKLVRNGVQVGIKSRQGKVWVVHTKIKQTSSELKKDKQELRALVNGSSIKNHTASATCWFD